MTLSGRFSYKRSNQRVLAFHTDIIALQPEQTVFVGSSSNQFSLIRAYFSEKYSNLISKVSNYRLRFQQYSYYKKIFSGNYSVYGMQIVIARSIGNIQLKTRNNQILATCHSHQIVCLLDQTVL